MILDFAIGGIVFLAGLFGYFRGAVRQIVQLVALAAAIVFSPRIATGLSSWVRGSVLPNAPPGIADLAAFAIAVIGLFVGVYVAGSLIVWALTPSNPHPILSRMNRMLGMGLGTAKGLVVALLLLAGLSTIPDQLVQQYPASLRSMIKGSATLYWVGRWNPVNYTQVIDELEDLMQQLRTAQEEASDLEPGVPPAKSRPRKRPSDQPPIRLPRQDQ